jgi:hypothetical protein
MFANRMIRLVLCVALPLILSAPAFAQTTSGSIAGNVVDTQQASIANATVTIAEHARKLTLVTKTDGAGRFVFPQLLPGVYDITVESPGFKKLERKDVELLANDQITVGAIVLDIGAVAESVEVQAQVVQLNTASAERSAAIVGKQLDNLAVNSRSYLQLAGIAPGIVSTNNLSTGGVGGLGSISANGARMDQNNLTLDGMGNVDTGSNGSQLTSISLDSVQEFKILTSNYQAEYGRSSGAQISVVTKSGTSSFHGSGYLFHRNESLNANFWKNNRDGIARNLFRFNDPGYTIGGPVFIPKVFNRNKDKLFFFFSQEYQQQLRPEGRRDATFPTDLERRGDFSQSVDKNGNPFPYIRDPLSGSPCATTATGDHTGCFNGGGVLGRIPGDRLYAPGIAVLNFFPKPNALSTANKGFNFTSQIPDSYPRREDLIRGDYNLSEKWKIFSRFVKNKDAVTSPYGSFVLGSGFPIVPISDVRPGYSLVISATTIFSPTVVNEATFGIGHNKINIDAVTDGLTRAKTGINIPLLYPSAVQQDYIPRFAYAGSRIGNEQRVGSNDAPFVNYNTTLHWIDNLTKVWNAHVFKAGVYIERSRKDQTSFANFDGDISFADNSSNPLDTGFGFANMAIGVFSTYTQASKFANGMYRYTNGEWYIQDQWKVSRRLTLDYGMRFEYIQPQFDASLQTATFLPERFDPKQAPVLYRPAKINGVNVAVDPTTGQTFPVSAIGKIVPGSGNLLNGIAQAGKGVSKYLVQNRGVHYSPRLGFAYDITGRQNFVLRGGGAIFYDRFQGNEVFDMLTNPPTTFAPTLVNGFLKDVDPKNVLIGPSGLNAFDYNGKVPTVYSFSLGLQTRLPYQMVLDTSYVGSQSRHQLERLNLNAIPYGATFLPQNQDPTKSSSVLGSAALNADFLRPYQGFGDITLHQFGGTANYNSMQTSLNRRFSKGLFFGMNWTWSRALGTTSDRTSFHRIDGLTRFANYGPVTFDRHHTVNIFYTYDLPSIIHSNGIVHAVVDGWQLSGGTLFQSGNPYSVNFSIPGIGNQNLTGSYTEGARVQVIGNPNQGTTDSPYNRINAAAFTIPPIGTIGLGAPLRYLRGPGTNNTNFSVQKSFSVRERMRVELRADAFNVFNHTQFGGVGGGGVDNNSGINSTINFKSLTDPTPTNLYLKPDGTVNDKNGFGTVSGTRDPRILQLVVRVRF